MQKIRYFIVALLFASIVSAQSELWPTANAEWHYTQTDDMLFFGFTHYKIERDTSLLGKNCQIYSREYKTLFTGLPFDTIYHNTEDIYYIIGIEDSVLYKFSFERNTFDTIINFKANIGDTWKSYYVSENCIPDEGEPYFVTKVLNKETEVVNGLTLLKFILERNVPGKDMNTTDVFYQLIGGTNGNFVYNKICFASDFSVESKLRCFSYHTGESDEYSYKTVEDCESISQLNVKNVNELKNINFKVEKDYLHIQGVENENFEVSFVDLTGKVILKASNQHQIDIRALKGLIVVQLNTENSSKVVKFNFM